MKRVLAGLGLFWWMSLVGCAEFDALVSPPQPATPPPVASTTTACNSPRPTICTMEYRPVCARMRSGRDVTYASACNACADVAVISYHANACENGVNQ